MEKYPTSEPQTTTEHKPRRHTLRIALAVFVVLIVVIGVFAYLHRPVIGTVTKVSSTSITIKPNGSLVTKTYKITSATLLGLPTSHGISLKDLHPQKFNAKDIKVGESVAINVDSNNDQAQAISVVSSN